MLIFEKEYACSRHSLKIFVLGGRGGDFIGPSHVFSTNHKPPLRLTIGFHHNTGNNKTMAVKYKRKYERVSK
jgi:hypothetical protein